MPYLDDYGGNYRGRRRRTKRTKENMRSYHCLHCEKLFYLTHRQATRRSGVHCPNCGGPGEESEESFQRRTGNKKEDAARLVGKIGAIDTNRKGDSRVVAITANDPKPFYCESCYKQFRTEVALKLHYEDHPDHEPEDL